MLRIAWFGKKIDQKNILKFFYPPQIFFVEKNRKVLRIAWFGKKIGQKNILKILPHPPDLKQNKNEKGLELHDLARKLIRIFVWKFWLPPQIF